MQNTFEEINKKLEYFAENSGVVNEYNCDDFTRFFSNNHKYPLIWSSPVNMNIVDGRVGFTTQLAFMDKVSEKEDQIKTLSDLAITVAELHTYLNDQSDDCYYYLEINNDFKPFFRQVDNVTGWQGNVTFRVRYIANTELIRWKT